MRIEFSFSSAPIMNQSNGCVTLHLCDSEVNHDELTDYLWSPLLLDQKNIISVLVELVLLLLFE
jgi:hypothetical protein